MNVKKTNSTNFSDNFSDNSSELQTAFIKYRENFELLLEKNIPKLGEKTKLRDACEYALRNGGKRFRPALVYMVADALNKQADVSQAALAVEYLHTASLIADDLPCMDNDDERRNKPSLHKAFDESIALMASYALISAGYGCIANNARELGATHLPHAKNAERLCTAALENVTWNTGLSGATGGQFLDLSPPNFDLSTIRDVIQKKTGSLFEISFVLGWLFGGGELDLLPNVKKTASHFGAAFQIADDIGDMDQDRESDRKVNIANIFGIETAKQMFHEELENYQKSLLMLPINTALLSHIHYENP